MSTITVQCSVREHIEAFLEYLKTRAKDKVHAKNGDIIADFVDHFIVVEMKRLASKDESFDTEIEIPSDLVLAPLKEAKLKMDKIFEEFFKTKGVTASVPDPVTTAPTADPSTPAIPRKRNGNGHKSLKVRNLIDSEKDAIRNEFMNVNGQIENDACVRFKAKNMSPDVAIFQVTGFVSYLHFQVADGRIAVRDPDAYETFLQGHRDLWARYNSPKYQALRAAAKKAA